MTDKELEMHSTSFAELIDNPAFKAAREHFESLSSYRDQNGDMSLDELGKAYIRESAIKHVFRTIETWAKGIVSEEDPDLATALEAETLDDNAFEILDNQ